MRQAQRWLVAGLAWLLTQQAAGQAVVVLSSEAEPYRQAAFAFNEHLQSQGMRITTIQFSALDDQMLSQLLSEQPSLVTAIGSEAAASLSQRLPADVPLTYCLVADPDAAGLVQRDNAAGVSTQVGLDDQFKLIAQAMPNVRRIGMLYQSDSSRSSAQVQRVRQALPSGWQLKAISISDHDSIADAVNALFNENIDFVWTAADSAVYDAATIRALLLRSVRSKVPVFGFSSGFVRAGAMLGVSLDPAQQGTDCAQLSLQHIGGSSTAGADRNRSAHDAPNFQIEINLVVAEMLGVELSDEFVRRAHRVIRPE